MSPTIKQKDLPLRLVFFVLKAAEAVDTKQRHAGSTTSNRRDAGTAGFATAKIALVRRSETTSIQSSRP